MSLNATPEHHWEKVYRTKASREVSWYRPHLETSLRWIRRHAPDLSASVIDVGAGSSTLADDLLATGYSALTLLDISEAALAVTKTRLGDAAGAVQWICGNVNEVVLPRQAYDVWHDRAVFHFLVEEGQRAAYLQQLSQALKRDGLLVLATFGADGPQRCSGLPVRRYDAAAMSEALGPDYVLQDQSQELHATPSGATQAFQYGVFRRRP